MDLDQYVRLIEWRVRLLEQETRSLMRSCAELNAKLAEAAETWEALR